MTPTAILPRVMTPSDAGDVARVLKDANEAGLAVVPRGGGTKRTWMNPPRCADVILSSARLDRIVEHAWADLTVTVEPGCTIAALQSALRTQGQRLAIDPLWPERATIGGVLSANDSGALRLRFGGLRDLVIGTHLALADGTLARSGGKVVKNVAGYDLSKLVTGAFGTLGVITSATFRLHPIPQVARTCSARLPDAASLQAVVNAVQDSTLAHSAVQACAGRGSLPRIDVLFEGTAAGVEAQIDQLARLAPAVRFEDAAPEVWSARQDLWSGGEPRDAIAKISTLPAEIARTCDRIAAIADAARLDWAAVMYATGLGALRFSGAADRWPAALRDLRAFLTSLGGSAVVHQAPAGAAAVDVWGEAGDALLLMQAVKQQFDPKGTLNPGVLVGGI